MSERILTPFEEMQEQISDRIAADIGRIDYYGSFARLQSRFDPNMIARWASEEFALGVPGPDMSCAFAQIMACSLLSIAGSMENPRLAYQILIKAVHYEACRRISGEVPTDVVQMGLDGSRQIPATIEGMFRDRGGSDA